MNPLVELRSVGGPSLWPTRKQKELAEQDIVSLYRARLEGFRRDLLRRLQEAGVLQQPAVAEKAASGAAQSAAQGTSGAAVTRAAGELGKDAFLQLLVTQMQYQDPLSPMDNTDMIAQLAQFSALEQMNNLNATTQAGLGQVAEQLATLNMLGAQNLIGRTVSGVAADSQTPVTGRVSGVSWESGTVLLTLEDGTRLAMSTITAIQSGKDAAKGEAAAYSYSVPSAPVPGTLPVAGTPVAATPQESATPDVVETTDDTLTQTVEGA